MWHRYRIIPTLIIILIFITNTKCHTPKNNSDVIVTYAGHAEANMDQKIISVTATAHTTERVKIIIPEYLFDEAETTTTVAAEVTEDIVLHSK